MRKTGKTGFILTSFLGLLVFLLTISFILFPETVFHSSLKGLKIWWDIVFPATLPFFITSEILMGFGVAHFLGVLLEPVMRPLFNIPGSGAFALAMGFSSGYPMGAKLTVRLKEQKLITRSEGERLVSFTSTSDPLFMFGAVAVGFFHDVTLGIIIVVVHYISAIILGFIMRFHEPLGEKTVYQHTGENILIRAMKAMHRARIQDGRPFGKLMGDAVSSSIQTLLLIGGLIMIFSVIINIMGQIHMTDILSNLFSGIFLVFGIPTVLTPSAINGLFEVTLGAQVASEASSSVPMMDKIAVASAVIAWSGLSVHAQVASILSKTDIRYQPYLIARVIHTVIACILTYVLWVPLHAIIVNTSALPAFFQRVPGTSPWTIWDMYLYSGIRILGFFGIMFVLALLFSLIKNMKGRITRTH